MKALEFDEVAKLLNASRSISIDLQPAEKEQDQWALYRGAYQIHGRRFPFQVLYLQSRATTEAIRRARKGSFSARETQVVYAPSLDRRTRAHHELLSKEAERFVTLNEYLASFLREELQGYTARLKAREPNDYVPPKVEVPTGLETKIPNPLQLMLDDPPKESEETDGAVGVLLAEPGQGKTYMCNYLAARLAKTSELRTGEFAPIYVSAEQWHSMPEQEFSSLWKTVAHCFRHFEVPIPWLEGCEDLFLTTTLKAGLFKVIFDGFDEYVLRSKGEVSAIRTLSDLMQLSRATGARIVITTRTTFWNSEVSPQLSAISGSINEYRLSGFDRNEAANYFTKKLGADAVAATANALALYDDLRKFGPEFVGRGFFLSLVADLFRGTPDYKGDGVSGGPVLWLMTALCERERLRQALPLTATQQLTALMYFASDVRLGSEASSSTLDLALMLADQGIAGQEMNEQARQVCLQKMSSHPLISRDATGAWRISQEQVEMALLARYVAAAIQGENASLGRFSAIAKLEDAEIGDLASMLIEQMGSDEEVSRESAVRKIAAGLLRASDAGNAVLPRLGTHVCLRYVDNRYPRGTERADRTKLLLAMLDRTSFERLTFSASLNRFDFTGTVFRNCRFDNVRWGNCVFDSETRFERCSFQGGNVDYCQGFGAAKFIECEGDVPGLALIASEQIAAGKLAYTRENLRGDFGAVLMKFAPKGGHVLKTLLREHLVSGSVRKSKYREEILEEIERSLVEEHRVSGATDRGIHVRENAKDALRFFATNNVFSGPIQDAFERLARKLAL